MSRKDKRQRETLHLLTRLSIGGMICLAILTNNQWAMMLLTMAWLFEPELVKFERKALKML
jgi:hypothetical protein